VASAEGLLGLKPACIVGGLYAALKAPLFHGGAGIGGGESKLFVISSRIKINIKGVGQECPTHTIKIKVKS